MPNSVQSLTAILRGEIEATGPISCARFMEVALYHPIHGYYHRNTEQIGCQGDFYTSVSAGPLFGQLLAFQFSEWLDPCEPALGKIGPEQSSAFGAIRGLPCARNADGFQLVEAGAHNGRLAADILSWLQANRPALAEQIEYWIIEPSAELRRKQEAFLQRFRPTISWFNQWADVPRSGIQGIIFSNELLDSFPFYRGVWDAAGKTWFEERITWAGDRFAWERTPVESEELKTELQRHFWRNIHPDLLKLLPDGFSVEFCPAARAWWSEAAEHLSAGKLLTCDYGLEAHEFLAPQRSAGTFRSYRQHLLGQDPLENPGEQDLTAHVNFTTLEETGKAAGLHTDYVGTQSAFLTRIAESVWKDLRRFGPWTSAQNRQFQTLTHPDHLGRSFRVLVQSRTKA